MTAGDVELIGGRLDLIEAAVQTLRSAGVTWKKTEKGFRVQRTNGALTGVDVMTEALSRFPTTCRRRMALMTRDEGASMIPETVLGAASARFLNCRGWATTSPSHHERPGARRAEAGAAPRSWRTDLRPRCRSHIAALAAKATAW